LEPFKTDVQWVRAVAASERNDPRIRGIVVLGLDAPETELCESFKLAARFPMVKGFAVGRTIFAQAAREWMASGMDDAEAVRVMAANYGRLCDIWDAARAEQEEKVE
jgi:5-dehydro-2-deoxygluconokinase